jgi:hypothetical protein
MGKSAHLHDWLERRKAKQYIKRRGMNPDSMFKVVNDYGWGDKSETMPMSLYDAIKEYRSLEPVNASGLQGMFDPDFVTHIEECQFGWH